MRYSYFIFLLIFFVACSEKTDKSSGEKQSDNQNDSTKIEIARIDSCIYYLDHVSLNIEELRTYSVRFVKEQTRSDDLLRKEYLQAEIDISRNMRNLARNTSKEDVYSLKAMSDSLIVSLQIVDELKSLLPDFASYDDVSNVFIAETLVATDGELNTSLKAVKVAINEYKDLLLKQRKRINPKS